MGILLVAVALFVLLLAHGADGSRSHPTGEEVKQKSHAPINGTSSIPGLIDHVSPHQDSSSDANIVCFAYHGAATAPNGCYGFIGTMDVYGFPLAQGQGSAAAVLPDLYGDSKTHFYAKWTNDGFQSTGCLNMKCNGFQPEKGAAITPGDSSEKKNLNLKIIKNGTSGDWLVHCGLDREPQLIGRFPRSLFTGGFADKAVGLTFGGVVSAPITKPTPMGSGYLPTDVKSAASIGNIQLVDQNG
uniref:Neprosin PEP catalytic domain-containing protein n=1 Tax=Setaria viridis TaxID=4556 RepID=A0A4U6VFX7_SETVI|nr:hypothetical protein SEVIR_4G267100v2 [Setaria viridis]